MIQSVTNVQNKSNKFKKQSTKFSGNQSTTTPQSSGKTDYTLLGLGVVAASTIALGALGHHHLGKIQKSISEASGKASDKTGNSVSDEATKKAQEAVDAAIKKAEDAVTSITKKGEEAVTSIAQKAETASVKIDAAATKSEAAVEKIEIAAIKGDRAAEKAEAAAAQAGKNGLSIWGETYLDLKKGKKITDGTIRKIRNEITSSLNCKHKMQHYDKTHVVSVSYEGWGGMAGGQHDVANELPVALQTKGVKTTVVAPLFKMKIKGDDKAGFSLTPVEGSADKFIYKTNSALPGGAKEIEVTKVYDEKMTGTDDKLQVFHAKVGPEKTDVLFVHDDRLFDLQEIEKPNIYADTNHSAEKTRMAQFNNMTYELLMKMKEGKIAVEGQAVEAPNKMLAHEAWQSGGLLQKMKLYSHVEESEKARGEQSKELGAYVRELADNTGVIIHNIGDGYQGWPQVLDKTEPFEPMEEYCNTLFGEHAREMVKHSMIEDLFGTEHQRVGFVGNWMNPAHASVVLSSEIGSVSEGYTQELVNKGLGVKLTSLLKLKYEKGGLVSYPNGVDKKAFAATKANVATINKKLESLGRTERIKHYTEIHTDKVDHSDPAQIADFAAKHEENRTVFLTLIKEAVQGYKATPKPEQGAKTFDSMIFNGGKFKGFHGKEEYVDLSDLDPTKKVPIFSMASRLDPQKGFDTMADGIYITMKQISEDAKLKGEEKPIFFISGDGHPELSAYMAKVQEKLHTIDPELTKRILFTKDRLSNEGLLLTNMTSTSVMPSDFEPFGISDIKGGYAGARMIVTDVGGMKASGKISRKIFGLHDDPEAKEANAIVIRDYEFMCTAETPEQKKLFRRNNAKKLAAAMLEDMRIEREDSIKSTKMNINALNTDVSWDKKENGALGNYLERLQIVTPEKAPKAPEPANA